jgi:hypothetical protein
MPIEFFRLGKSSMNLQEFAVIEDGYSIAWKTGESFDEVEKLK